MSRDNRFLNNITNCGAHRQLSARAFNLST